jgi:hypothetical protein
MGDAAGARRLLERALRNDAADYGPDHPHAAAIGDDLNLPAGEPVMRGEESD